MASADFATCSKVLVLTTANILYRMLIIRASFKPMFGAVEQMLVTAVGEVAKLTRQAQQAGYEDAQAFFSGVDQLASAKCVGEAVQIYVDYMRNRSDVAMARARTVRDLFGKLVASGANTGQKTIANDGPFNKAA